MNGIEISTDKTRLNTDLIFNFLNTQARWCAGIPRATVEKAIEHSLCFGAYIHDEQVGFARVVTDYATFGNLVDVFVVPEYRNTGIARQLMEEIVGHPDLIGLRRFMLATSDKHELYRKFGFKALNRPEIFMEVFKPDIYR